MQDMVRNMNEIKRAGMAEWFWERLKILKASAFSRTGEEQNRIRWQRSVGKEFGVNMVGKGKPWKALNMTITWVEYTLQVKKKSAGESEGHMRLFLSANWKWWMPPGLLHSNCYQSVRGLKRNRKRCISETFPGKR